MKILIAVPSKGRENNLERNTLGWLRYTKFDYKFFVEPKDYDKYINSMGGLQNLVKLSKNDGGLYYAKQQIWKYAKENNYDIIFKLDDDVQSWRDPANRGLGKNAPKRTKEYRCNNLFDPLIENCLKVFKEFPEVGGVSLLYGNEMRKFNGDAFIDFNRRFQSCYLVRRKFFKFNLKKGKGVFEDFLTYIRIRSLGYKTIQYGLTGMDIQPVGKNEGGHQSFDRRETNLLEKYQIEKLFPWVAWKKVEKNWDWEPDFRKTKFPYE